VEAKTRYRRPSDWRDVFSELSPVALTVWGHYAPVPRGFGDNRGALPVKIGTSGQWVTIEKLGSAGERFHPLYAYGIWYRVWTPDLESANALAYALTNILADARRKRELTHHEQLMIQEIRALQRGKAWLRNGHIDLTPELDLSFIDTQRMRKHLGLSVPATAAQQTEQRYLILQGKLEAFTHQLAGDLCIQAWDDEGFAAHINGILERRAQKPADGIAGGPR
jgi:hypothetical protein